LGKTLVFVALLLAITAVVAAASRASAGQANTGGSRGAIAFMSMRSVGEELVTTSRAINANGSGLRRLRWAVESGVWEWSPGGAKIAYRGDNGVYVMNADGTRRRRIARGNGWGYSWSPDGMRLAYFNPAAGVCVVDVARATTRQVAKGRDVAWSPRGDRLAFVQGDALLATRPDGTDVRLISRGVPAKPRWSPDGKRIAYVQHVQEQGLTLPSAYLYSANADGSSAGPLTPLTVRFQLHDSSANFDWSPRGDRIVLYTIRDEVLVIRADGGGVKRVADGAFAHTEVGPPKWSPDGTRIAFVRGSWPPVRRRGDIWIMNADGSQKKRLTRNHAARGDDLQPRWEPRGRMAAQLPR
jgi:Tol biopolymer transport system component